MLAGVACVIYLWQRHSNNTESNRMLPAPRRVSLFEASRAEDDEVSRPVRVQRIDEARERSLVRARLLRRTSAGDLSALLEAREDEALYTEMLSELISRATSADELLALASFVAEHNDLRARPVLSECYRQEWARAPHRHSTAAMLHLAARSDDPAAYQAAAEAAMLAWKEGRLTDITPDELRQLVESEYWVLPSSVRSTGAGFVLRRALVAGLRSLRENRDARL